MATAGEDDDGSAAVLSLGAIDGQGGVGDPVNASNLPAGILILLDTVGLVVGLG